MLMQATMVATASPSSVSGGPAGGSGSPSITNATTVSVAYGVAPFTYAWEKVSGGNVSITSPTNATTTFSSIAADVPTFATFRCLVTDGRGLSAYSNDVTATTDLA